MAGKTDTPPPRDTKTHHLPISGVVPSSITLEDAVLYDQTRMLLAESRRVMDHYIIQDNVFLDKGTASPLNIFLAAYLLPREPGIPVTQYDPASGYEQMAIAGECECKFQFNSRTCKLSVVAGPDRQTTTANSWSRQSGPTLVARLQIGVGSGHHADNDSSYVAVCGPLFKAVEDFGKLGETLRKQQGKTLVKRYDVECKRWEVCAEKPKRTWPSIAGDDKTMTAIRKEIGCFKHLRRLTTVPDAGRRVYLLHGPPGSGKSSIAAAMAADLDYDIFRLSLQGLTEKAFGHAMLDLGRIPSLILLEDVDAAFAAGDAGVAGVAGRNTDKHGMSDETPEMDAGVGVSFSTFLNMLSGPEAPLEAVFVLTTNRVQTFDAAVLRRISKSWQIEGVTSTVVAAYLIHHLGEDGGLAHAIANYMTNPPRSEAPYEMVVLNECLVRAYADNVNLSQPPPDKGCPANIPKPTPAQLLAHLRAYVRAGDSIDAARAKQSSRPGVM